MIKIKTGEKTAIRVIAYVVTVIFSFVMIIPLIYLFSSSMKDDLQIYDTPPTFLPKPPISIGVVVDYSDYADQDAATLKDTILKDSTLAMYSIIYEINKSGVFGVDFYGTIGDEVIYSSSAMKLDLQLNLTYRVYDRARVNRENLLEKYLKSSEYVKYQFDLNGLNKSFNKNKIGKSEYEAEIGDFLRNKYGITGKLIGAIETKSYGLAVKNYFSYWEIPKVMFSDNKMISTFSFLWFAFNTVIVICFAILAQIVIDSLAGFALSRLFGIKWSKILLIFIMSASMIPFVAYMVPMYVMFQKLSFTNSYLGMLIPHTTAAGFFVYLYKGFFDKLPKELFEAAKIDGAGDIRCYLKICMPLSKPATAVIAINTLLGVWNDFFWPYLVAKNVSLWPLNVALYNFSRNSNVKQNFIMGMAALALIPLLILVAIFGDSLKKGMVFTGIKG